MNYSFESVNAAALEAAIDHDDAAALSRLVVEWNKENETLAATSLRVCGEKLLPRAYRKGAAHCVDLLLDSLQQVPVASLHKPLLTELDQLARMAIARGDVPIIKRLIGLNKSRTHPDERNEDLSPLSLLKLTLAGDFRITGPRILKTLDDQDLAQEMSVPLAEIPHYHDVVDVLAGFAVQHLDATIDRTSNKTEHFLTLLLDEESSDPNLIKVLAKHGANLDLPIKDGPALITPLDFALGIKDHARRDNVLSALLECGARRFTGSTLTDPSVTPLPVDLAIQLAARLPSALVASVTVKRLLDMTPSQDRLELAVFMRSLDWPFEVTCYAMAVADTENGSGELLRGYLATLPPRDDVDLDGLAHAFVSDEAFEALLESLGGIERLAPSSIHPADYVVSLPAHVPDGTVVTLVRGLARHGIDLAAHRTAYGDGLISQWVRALSLDTPRFLTLRVLRDEGLDINELDYQAHHALWRFSSKLNDPQFHDDQLAIAEELIATFGADPYAGDGLFGKALADVINGNEDRKKTPRVRSIARAIAQRRAQENVVTRVARRAPTL